LMFRQILMPIVTALQRTRRKMVGDFRESPPHTIHYISQYLLSLWQAVARYVFCARRRMGKIYPKKYEGQNTMPVLF